MINPVGITRKGIIAIITAFIFAICVIIYHNNYAIALTLNGFKPSEVNILYTGINANNDEYRVIHKNINAPSASLALVTKGKLGLWRVEYTSHAVSEEMPITVFSWAGGVKLNGFSPTDNMNVNFEWHNVYVGNNAIKKIESISEYLPPNVAVDIQQSGSAFLLHIMSFNMNEAMNEFDVTEALRKSGYIT